MPPQREEQSQGATARTTPLRASCHKQRRDLARQGQWQLCRGDGPARQASAGEKPQWRVIQSDDDRDVGDVNDDALLAEMGKSSWGTMALTAPLAVN